MVVWWCLMCFNLFEISIGISTVPNVWGTWHFPSNNDGRHREPNFFPDHRQYKSLCSIIIWSVSNGYGVDFEGNFFFRQSHQVECNSRGRLFLLLPRLELYECNVLLCKCTHFSMSKQKQQTLCCGCCCCYWCCLWIYKQLFQCYVLWWF